MLPRPLLLLHGLARTRHSLWPIAADAARHGYAPVGVGYPSRRGAIAELAAGVADEIARRVPEGTVDVVTHSMGGIVLRTAVAEGLLAPERIGRAVMLAPPNQGSELAEWLRARWYYARLLGPAALELGTGPESVPRRLPPVPFALGVIAGARTVFPALTARVFPGATDGRVAVEGTRVAGMADSLVVARGHTFLMWAPEVRAAVFEFLRTGRFARPAEAPPGAPPGAGIPHTAPGG
jgi:hypothetical protein